MFNTIWIIKFHIWILCTRASRFSCEKCLNPIVRSIFPLQSKIMYSVSTKCFEIAVHFHWEHVSLSFSAASSEIAVSFFPFLDRIKCQCVVYCDSIQSIFTCIIFDSFRHPMKLQNWFWIILHRNTLGWAALVQWNRHRDAVKKINLRCRIRLMLIVAHGLNSCYVLPSWLLSPYLNIIEIESSLSPNWHIAWK